MIKPGDNVKARHVDFSGTVLAPHGRMSEGGAPVLWSEPNAPNVPIVAVWNKTTGEVRFFQIQELEAA